MKEERKKRRDLEDYVHELEDKRLQLSLRKNELEDMAGDKRKEV